MNEDAIEALGFALSVPYLTPMQQAVLFVAYKRANGVKR